MLRRFCLFAWHYETLESRDAQNACIITKVGTVLNWDLLSCVVDCSCETPTWSRFLFKSLQQLRRKRSGRVFEGHQLPCRIRQLRPQYVRESNLSCPAETTVTTRLFESPEVQSLPSLNPTWRLFDRNALVHQIMPALLAKLPSFPTNQRNSQSDIIF